MKTTTNCFTQVTVISPATGDENILENIGNPQDVEWIVIENTKYHFKFKLHKMSLGRMDYNNALEETEKLGGRPGTRFELITLYNAIMTHDLNSIIKAIGGDPLVGYHWTEESDEDPRYNAADAWFVNLNYGYVYGSTKASGHRVRLISAF
jgi:hypothetical protein